MYSLPTRTFAVSEMPNTAIMTAANCLDHSRWLKPPGGLRGCRNAAESVAHHQERRKEERTRGRRTHRTSLGGKLESLPDGELRKVLFRLSRAV